MEETKPTTPRSDDAWSDEEVERFRKMLGGKRGMIDGAVPAILFVVTNAIWTLTTAALVAGIYAVLALLFRAVRREPIRQGLIGLIGLGVSVGLALWTGSASAYFVPGVAWGFLTGILFFLSILVRQPSSAMMAMVIEKKPREYYEHPMVRRAHTLVTAVWALTFLGRAGLRAWLISKDQPELLGASSLLLGYPVTIGLIAASAFYLRRTATRVPPELQVAAPTDDNLEA
ncbi:MAG: VC0807 family protein [Actinomycetota bacterium]